MGDRCLCLYISQLLRVICFLMTSGSASVKRRLPFRREPRLDQERLSTRAASRIAKAQGYDILKRLIGFETEPPSIFKLCEPFPGLIYSPAGVVGPRSILVGIAASWVFHCASWSPLEIPAVSQAHNIALNCVPGRCACSRVQPPWARNPPDPQEMCFGAIAFSKAQSSWARDQYGPPNTGFCKMCVRSGQESPNYWLRFFHFWPGYIETIVKA